MSSVAPRQADNPPNVVMNGGTLRPVVICPCMKPAAAPNPTAVHKANNHDGCKSSPASSTNQAAPIAANPSTDPTARSTPAEMITKVMPTATIPQIDTSVRM